MRRLYASLLLIPILVSCSKFESDTATSDRMFLRISAPEQTRTTLGEGTTLRPVLWKSGDEIIVNNDFVGTVGPDDDGKSTARISIETFIAGPYNVFYPRKAMNEDGTVTVAEVQSYTAGTFDGDAAFMAGYSESDDVPLKNMCGFIRLRITSAQPCMISSLTLSSSSSEPLSGIFNVDCREATLSPLTTKDFVRMEDVEVTSKGADVVLSVVPGEYSGFRLRLVSDAQDGNNLMQAAITAATLEIKAGHLVDIGTVVFDPQQRANEILTPAGFESFITAAAAGDYSQWIDARSGEVLIGADIDCAGLTLPQVASFDGVLNGQGYSLKNLHLEDGLFDAVTGTVKNLTFDSTCSFVFPVTDTTAAHYRGMLCRQCSGTISGCESYATCEAVHYETLYRRFFGTFAGYCTGTISSCVNHTSYDITIDSVLGAPNMGCVVGNVTKGKCLNCINYGDFHFKAVATSSNIYVAGVVGAASSTTSEGLVNYGDVTMEFPGAAKVAPIIGGVAAIQQSGTNVSSVNHGAVTLICPESATTVRPYVGGLIGNVDSGSVTGCENKGPVDVSGNFAAYSTVYTHVGGLVGLAGNASGMAAISSSSNSGQVSFSNATASTDIIRVAGLVGGLYGSLSSCQNSGIVTVAETGGAKSYVAGLVSYLPGTDCLVTSCVNSGAVTAYCTNVNNKEFCVGGVNACSISCTMKDCTNEGDITAESHSISIIGGVSAYMYGTLTHKISNSTNTGAIKVNIHDGKTANVGGISGAGGAVSGAQYYISACRNTGNMDICVTGLHRVGGISGYGNLTSIEGSVNSGDIRIYNVESFTSTAYQYIGGILGTASTSYNYKTLVACTNSGSISIETQAKVRLGGIMAYANVAVENMGCSNTGRLYTTNVTDGSNVGGIVGYCNKNLSGCVSKCEITNESTASVTVGGLVGSFHNASGLTFSGSQIDCTISSTSSIPPAFLLGQQLNDTSAGKLGDTDAPISVTPTTTLNGVAISNPIVKSEAVGDLKTENLIDLANVVIFTPSTGLCSYLESQTKIPGSGATASLVVTIGDEPCTIESTNYGWIRFSDSNPTEAAAGEIVNVSYNALGSFGPAGRSCKVRVTGKTSGQFQDIEFTQPSADEWVRGLGTYELAARWQQTTAFKGKISSKWVDYGYLPSHTGNGDQSKNGGFLSLVRTDKNEALAPIQRSYNSIAAYATCIGEGDYWLVTIPRVTCSKDDWFGFFMTMTANAKAPKYFLFEYWDGENWVTRDDHLLTAEEDSSIKYSFSTPGTVIEMAGEYATFSENFCPGQDLNDGMIYARLRAVGKYTADGSTLNVTNTTSAECGWAPSAFTAMYFNKYEGARPSVSKTVFFVGNSFTYYYNTITKLQQIAWCQGLEINARAFLKGGVTYDTHLSCNQCLKTIALGGYDYAIIQGSSKLEPDYGRDPSNPDLQYVMNDARAMVAELLKYSPQCKVYHEMEWATQHNAETRITAADLAAHSMEDTMENRMAILDEYIGVFCDEFLKLEPSIGITPVGLGFTVGRADVSDVNLYSTDNHHENSYGAYLKACVNCMALLGRSLDGYVPTMDGLATENTSRLQTAAIKAYGQYPAEKK